MSQNEHSSVCGCRRVEEAAKVWLCIPSGIRSLGGTRRLSKAASLVSLALCIALDKGRLEKNAIGIGKQVFWRSEGRPAAHGNIAAHALTTTGIPFPAADRSSYFVASGSAIAVEAWVILVVVDELHLYWMRTIASKRNFANKMSRNRPTGPHRSDSLASTQLTSLEACYWIAILIERGKNCLV